MTTTLNPAPLKKVVLCADDFAVHLAASEGIARLAALGRISATSAMVLSPRWAEDAPLLHDLRGQIDVGLHLDWTSDFAQAAGHGLSLGRAMLRSVVGGFDKVKARAVIEHQLDAFEAVWKAPPDHVDGHQHVQQFAGIREALMDTLVRRYPQRKPYIRISRAPSGHADFKSRIISGMGANATINIANYLYTPWANALFGVYDFSGTVAGYARRMDGWLQYAPLRTIIMCHPANLALPGDPIGTARAREFEYLSGEGFGAALARHHIRLVTGANW
jgi:chitin disaccharide deacetylase